MPGTLVMIGAAVQRIDANRGAALPQSYQMMWMLANVTSGIVGYGGGIAMAGSPVLFLVAW